MNKLIFWCELNVGWRGKNSAEGVFATFQCFLSHLTGIMKSINFYVNCHFQLSVSFSFAISSQQLIGFNVDQIIKIERKYERILTLAWNLHKFFSPRSIFVSRDNLSHLLPGLTPFPLFNFTFHLSKQKTRKESQNEEMTM